MRYVHRLLQLDEEGEEIEDELHMPVLRVHARVTVLPSLRESPITNETVQQMFDNHWRLHEHGIPTYHPSAPPHVPQIDDDEDEDEDDDLRPSEHEPLSDEEDTPPLDETFPLDESFPVIDIRPDDVDEDDDDDLRLSEHEPLSDEEDTPPLDETFPLYESLPVIDIRPDDVD